MSEKIKGRRIAASMLLELDRVCARENTIGGMSPQSLFAEYRYRGEPQDNIIWRFLQRAFGHGDECVEGFCAVLSDHCANAAAGGVIAPQKYLRVTEREIAEAPDAPIREQVLREANHPEATLH